jgi:hypothetical protein
MVSQPSSVSWYYGLASVLWRLRRATTMETGLFEIQAEHLRDIPCSGGRTQLGPSNKLRNIVAILQHIFSEIGIRTANGCPEYGNRNTLRSRFKDRRLGT